MGEVEIQGPEIRSTLSGLLGRPITSLESISGGRNSQIYRLACGNSGRYVAKFYFRLDARERDRLLVEFSSLQFLWENGLRCVPRPIVAGGEQGCAIYEYVDGKEIASEEVTNSDIDQAVRFLAALKELRKRKGSHGLAAASEACFSIQALVDNIALRLKKLSSLHSAEPVTNALHVFLNDEFTPWFHRITRWCDASLGNSGLSFTAELELEERTLSPSDFGFHNALRRADGQIIFLDFEYFGWDDPAKMICDFLLHPAMELPEERRRYFWASILSVFEKHRYLAQRVEIVYPLCGLKWCLILLNEFLGEHLLRRRFASSSALNRDDLQAEQLLKAKQMLGRISHTYKHFPYCD